MDSESRRKPEKRELAEMTRSFDVSMYEIPGHESMTQRAMARYLNDKEQDDAIQKRFENSPASFEKKLRSLWLSDELSDLVRNGLNHEDPAIRKISADAISSVRDFGTGVRADLVRAGLNHDDPVVRHICAEKISTLSFDDQSAFIPMGLDNDDPLVQVIAARHASKGGFDTSIRERIGHMVPSWIHHEDVVVQKAGVEMIAWAPKETRTALITFGLTSQDPHVQRASAQGIYFAPQEDVRELGELIARQIRIGFSNEDFRAQMASAYMIPDAPRTARAELIQIGLASKYPAVQLLTISTIDSVRDAALHEQVNQHIHDGLASKDPAVRRVSVEMIQHVPVDSRMSHIRAGLENDDPDVQKASARMIRFAQDDVREQLFQLAKERLGDVLVEPPLYEEGTFADDTNLFPRKAFEKTGSGTTLIGGTLKGKTIVRHIKPEAFFAWQRIFENFSLWRQKGFDYVPIEPIQSYRLNKDGLVDVYSGVLDLNLREWQDMCGDFCGELVDDSDEIASVCRQQGIGHGHLHFGNFSLRFFRDKDGHVDYSRKPRIYLIDFDQAVSP